MKKIELPKKIAVFPLSNFIIFPQTTVPLNIFEPRYIDMINDSMKSNKFVGMIQPKITKLSSDESCSDLHNIGCMGKITSFKETNNFVGPARVWLSDVEVPGLAMSRSLGDYVAQSVGVSPEPEINIYDISAVSYTHLTLPTILRV